MREREFKVVRWYEYSQPLMYIIQKLTNKQTHEILSDLVDEADKFIIECGIDVNDETFQQSYRYNRTKRLKKYITFPGTDVYMGVYVGISRSTHYEHDTGKMWNCNRVEYSFKLPTKNIRLREDEYESMVLDGMLIDDSEEISKPEMTRTKTKAERDAKEAERKAKRKAALEAREKQILMND
jgi:hypothetical protein